MSAMELLDEEPKDIDRRLRRTRISPESICALPITSRFTRADGTVVLIEHSEVPESSVHVRGVRFDVASRCFDALMSHESFPIVAEGDKILVLPIHGETLHRPNFLTRWGFGVSSEEWGRTFDSIAANEEVGAIVLDVDSPGGMHAGTEDMADRVFAARKAGRPIIAVSNDLMASAAYWVASAADEIVVSPGSLTGSIGTILMHVEYSKMLEEDGVKVTFMHAGEFKSEGNAFEPLTDEGKAHLQSLVDSAYADFRNAVARNRGVAAKTVESDFGQGRVFDESNAIRAGLADREATLDSVLLGLGVKNPGKRIELDAVEDSTPPVTADSGDSAPRPHTHAARRRMAAIGR